MTTETMLHGAADDLPPGVRGAMATMFARTFRGGGTPGRVWAAPTYHFLLLRGGAVVGHVGVHRRRIAVSGRMWAVAGIAKVGVLPEMRGDGLGTRLMAFAQATLRAQGRDDLGLLVTSADRLGFYGRLGWARIPGPVSYDDRGITKIETTPVLLLPLRTRATDLAAWHTGPVNIAGPFW